MWTEYFERMLTLMVMAVFLRASYELAKPKSDNPGTGRDPNAPNPGPRQKEWAEKAVKKYAEAQEKKWRNWDEAMFEFSNVKRS